jgi:hypothetical protein
MGNPLSPVIANILMDVVVKSTLKDLENKKITFNFITEYVDYFFSIVMKF